MRVAVIRIDKAVGGGHPVTLSVGASVEALASEAQGTFTQGGALAALPDLLLAGGATPQQLEDAGTALFAALESAGVAATWVAARKAGGLQTFLDLRAPELNRLPWELISSNWNAFGIDPERPISRWLELGPAAAPPRLPWPLRVLAVVGSEPGDQAVLAEQELTGLRIALNACRGRMDLHVLKQPGTGGLKQEFEAFRPHILHFIGHGRMVAERPCLVLQDAQRGVADLVDAGWLNLLLSGWCPRLVYLAACRGGAIDAQNAAWGMAGVLRQAGVHAVIAMQANVQGAAAALLSTTFYGQLANSAAVDVALAHARRSVALDHALARRDAFAAVLSLACAPEYVLPVIPVADEKLKLVKGVPEFAQLDRFVNQEAPRRRLATDGHLFVLSGESRVGTSWLTYWVLERCQLWDWTVCFADMKAPERLDLLQVLRALHWGDPKAISALLAPRKYPAALDAFGHVLNSVDELVAQGDLPARQGTAPVQDAMKKLSWRDLDHAAALRILSELRAAIATAATAERPLILAIDHLNMIAPHFENYFLPYLVAPIARGDLKHVRMILTMSVDARKTCGLDTLGKTFDDLRVGAVPPERYLDYATEFLHRIGKNTAADISIAQACAGKKTSPWKLESLLKLEQLVSEE